MMQKLFKIIYNFFAILIVLVFLFTAYLAVSKTHVYAVSTSSMEPTLSPGDAVFVSSVSFEELSVGDIVTVKLLGSDGTFTHRVCRVDEDKKLFYTKGDANSEQDGEAFPEQRLVGKVKFSFPKIGLLSLNTEPETIVGVLALVMLAVVCAGVIVNRRKKKTEA